MKYIIPLSPAEIETLQQMTDNHRIRRVRIRAHSIRLSDKGLSMSQIAQIYSTDARTVSCWISRWQQDGVAGLYDRPREGRPPILTPDEQQQVIRWIEESPRDLKKVGATIQQQINKPVSRKTIKRIAKKKGLFSSESGNPPPSTHQKNSPSEVET